MVPKKSKSGVSMSKVFLKMGIMLSFLIVASFFLDASLVMASGKTQLAKQSEACRCDMEDDSGEDGQDSLILISPAHSQHLVPLLNFPLEPSTLIVQGSQSPPDFPPEPL